MKQVSKEEFWKLVGPLNVHVRLEGPKYPWVSVFRLLGSFGQQEKIKGKIVPIKESWECEDGEAHNEYFVSDDLISSK